MRSLNLQQILSGAWQLAWHHKRTWFDLAIVPLIWLLALDLLLVPDVAKIAGLTAQTAQAKSGDVMSFLGAMLLYLFLSLTVWSMFASAWLRACLNVPLSSIPGLSWSIADMRVLGAAIRLVLILFMGFVVVMILFGSGAMSRGLTPSNAISFAFLALIAIAPLLARLSLILPAAATGQSARLIDAWRLTAGNGLRLAFMLLALVVLCYLAIYLATSTASALAVGILGAPLTLGPRLVLHLILNVLSLGMSALVLAVVALAYRQLTGPSLQVVPQERDSA
jgi:hypothetical protein